MGRALLPPTFVFEPHMLRGLSAPRARKQSVRPRRLIQRRVRRFSAGVYHRP